MSENMEERNAIFFFRNANTQTYMNKVEHVHQRTRELIKHLTLCWIEKQGHGLALRLAYLIGCDDIKSCNILSKYC